mmetsp:Transcript_52516/g.98322  ORF Transcript_52516/g.98322 Transcript_52516/m.98322 type:complete len:229 (-) Transcript_52516:303-989(-)
MGLADRMGLADGLGLAADLGATLRDALGVALPTCGHCRPLGRRGLCQHGRTNGACHSHCDCLEHTWHWWRCECYGYGCQLMGAGSRPGDWQLSLCGCAWPHFLLCLEESPLCGGSHFCCLVRGSLSICLACVLHRVASGAPGCAKAACKTAGEEFGSACTVQEEGCSSATRRSQPSTEGCDGRSEQGFAGLAGSADGPKCAETRGRCARRSGGYLGDARLRSCHQMLP